MIQTIASYALVTVMILLGLLGRISPWISIPLCLLAIYFGWKAFDENGKFYSLFSIFYALFYIIWILIKALI